MAHRGRSEVRKDWEKFEAYLQDANNYVNPDLHRLALKLATAGGKTTIMALLIAWQAINEKHHPGSP